MIESKLASVTPPKDMSMFSSNRFQPVSSTIFVTMAYGSRTAMGSADKSFLYKSSRIFCLLVVTASCPVKTRWPAMRSPCFRISPSSKKRFMSM